MSKPIQNSKFIIQNSAIDYADHGSFLNPLKNLPFFGRHPVTEANELIKLLTSIVKSSKEA